MRRPGRVTAALLCAALAACASGAAPEGGAGPAIRVVPTYPGAEIIQRSEDRASEQVLPVVPDSAWSALVAVYGELGIPTPTADRANRLLANDAFQVQGRLGGQSLAGYFNCGTGITGEVAASARLRISIRSQLTPHESGALLRTLAQATASSMQGASVDAVLCSSTGRLEGRIGNAVALRVVRKS